MSKVTTDRYANVAYASVLMTIANTLTFGVINMGVSLQQKMALCLHRILWQPSMAAMRELVAVTDDMRLALTSSNRLTSISEANDPAIIGYKRIVSIGAGVEPWQLPLETDYTMLPGGGKLIPPNPLYLAAHSSGFAAAFSLQAQLDFTFVELSDAEYLELLQTVYPANIA